MHDFAIVFTGLTVSLPARLAVAGISAQVMPSVPLAPALAARQGHERISPVNGSLLLKLWGGALPGTWLGLQPVRRTPDMANSLTVVGTPRLAASN